MSFPSPPKTWGAEILTSADLNAEVRDALLFLKQQIVWEAADALTVDTDAITVTQAYSKVAGESAAVDDIVTILGGAEGMVICLRRNGFNLTLKNGSAGAGSLNLGADVLLASDDDHALLIYGSDTHWHLLAAPRIQQTLHFSNFAYPLPASDWVPALEGATLAASLSTKKVFLPLSGLNAGDSIISYTLKGDVVEVAAATVDCQLVRVDLANPITHTDVAGGAIVQVTADGNFEAAKTLTAIETVATDKTYVLEITATTGAGDSVIVTGAEVVVWSLR
jgi:hypothetical protein